MSALQKAFSRREKIAKMISALDKMKEQGEITEDRYGEFKANYDGLLNDALTNLKEIRSKIKEQRDQIRAEIEELSREAKLVEIRGKTGEFNPQQVSKALTAIHTKRSNFQQHLTRYESQLEARSSTDLGGAVEVEINEKIEFQPEKQRDGQGLEDFFGDIKDKVKTLKESEMGQSLTKAVTHAREKVADVQLRSRQERLPVYTGDTLTMREDLKDSGTVTALSVIGLVFGLIGMLGSFIPCIGSLAFIIGVPATIVSGIALGIAYSQGAKRTFAIVALTISLIGVVISGVQYFSIVGAGKAAQDAIEQSLPRYR